LALKFNRFATKRKTVCSVVYCAVFNAFCDLVRTPGSFFAGFLIGLLTALGLVFLFTSDFRIATLFRSDASEWTADTTLDLSQVSALPRTPRSKSALPAAKITESSADSLQGSDSLQLHSDENSDEIIVMRDELIQTLNLELQRIGKNATSRNDSLIENLQGGNSERSGIFRMEFWKSPVNFKGYKMIRNTLSVYGLDPSEATRIYEFQNAIYLRSGATLFRLSQTDRYLPFQRVSDESLIKTLR